MSFRVLWLQATKTKTDPLKEKRIYWQNMELERCKGIKSSLTQEGHTEALIAGTDKVFLQDSVTAKNVL